VRFFSPTILIHNRCTQANKENNSHICFFNKNTYRNRTKNKISETILIKNDMKIGKHLRNKRHEKRLSQQEVGDYLNISQRTYSNFESDNSTPSIEQIVELSKLLDFDFLKLFIK
jgi:DNA-binding XRE family transcriptional regulator